MLVRFTPVIASIFHEEQTVQTDFDKYFKGKEVAHAYRIGKVKVFKEKKRLQDYGVRCAPQSFVYINY